MIYLEHRPHPALTPFIKSLWYACDPSARVHRHQRVLPGGHPQVILSLARDYLIDANHPTNPLSLQPAAILLGLYTRHQRIDLFDLAELMGIVFQPGGTLPFFPTETHLFTNRETSLEDLWPRLAPNLRTRLREAPTPNAKFAILESALLHLLARTRRQQRHPAVELALHHLHLPGTTISSLTHHTGLSTRRLSQLFHEQVGVSPKLYYRIHRFQLATHQLHHSHNILWAELALDCGYYDQSHFANDFHAFSGISPTTYSASSRPWVNHILLD